MHLCHNFESVTNTYFSRCRLCHEKLCHWCGRPSAMRHVAYLMSPTQVCAICGMLSASGKNFQRSWINVNWTKVDAKRQKCHWLSPFRLKYMIWFIISCRKHKSFFAIEYSKKLRKSTEPGHWFSSKCGQDTSVTRQWLIISSVIITRSKTITWYRV